MWKMGTPWFLYAICIKIAKNFRLDVTRNVLISTFPILSDEIMGAHFVCTPLVAVPRLLGGRISFVGGGTTPVRWQDHPCGRGCRAC